MKRYLPIIIAIALLAGFYFIAQNSKTNDSDYRLVDQSIQTQFNQLRVDYLNARINQQQYFKGVKSLAKKENDLVEEVKQYKFENITESNYWHRGRLKFPSNLKMEVERINQAQNDTKAD